MAERNDQLILDIMKANILLTNDLNIPELILTLLEQSREMTKSDLVCLYKFYQKKGNENTYKLSIKKGEYQVQKSIITENGFISFIKECKEAIVVLERRESPFFDILMNPLMNSGVALPLLVNNHLFGIVIVNSTRANFYDRNRLIYLESLGKTANNIFNNFASSKRGK